VRGLQHPCVEAVEALTGDEATSMVSRADTCESLEAWMPAVDHERTIRDYFDACTAGDARVIASFFALDAVHYFPEGDTYPDGSPQRAFRGADAIGHGFGDRFGGEFRTRWTVDHVIVDAERREGVIEWSNFKPSVSPDARLRGAEFYRFDAAGKIVEIRAYYACPPGGPGRPYELGEFDYAGRGYPVADR
jgi:ketosteroid isomerase-like protein